MTGAPSPEPSPPDPVAALDRDRRVLLVALADRLIPEGHGMPSAGAVVGDARLHFVLLARPDLLEPLRAALRPGLPADPAARLAALERDDPGALAALHLVIVGAYYTDTDVRNRIGYPGQQALQLYSWKLPEYIAEGLTDQVLARGPIWRDPSTGTTAQVERPRPAMPAERGA
jgi:hypothetical protein